MENKVPDINDPFKKLSKKKIWGNVKFILNENGNEEEMILCQNGPFYFLFDQNNKDKNIKYMLFIMNYQLLMDKSRGENVYSLQHIQKRNIKHYISFPEILRNMFEVDFYTQLDVFMKLIHESFDNNDLITQPEPDIMYVYSQELGDMHECICSINTNQKNYISLQTHLLARQESRSSVLNDKLDVKLDSNTVITCILNTKDFGNKPMLCNLFNVEVENTYFTYLCISVEKVIQWMICLTLLVEHVNTIEGDNTPLPNPEPIKVKPMRKIMTKIKNRILKSPSNKSPAISPAHKTIYNSYSNTQQLKEAYCSPIKSEKHDDIGTDLIEKENISEDKKENLPQQKTMDVKVQETREYLKNCIRIKQFQKVSRTSIGTYSFDEEMNNMLNYANSLEKKEAKKELPTRLSDIVESEVRRFKEHEIDSSVIDFLPLKDFGLTDEIYKKEPIQPIISLIERILSNYAHFDSKEVSDHTSILDLILLIASVIFNGIKNTKDLSEYWNSMYERFFYIRPFEDIKADISDICSQLSLFSQFLLNEKLVDLLLFDLSTFTSFSSRFYERTALINDSNFEFVRVQLAFIIKKINFNLSYNPSSLTKCNRSELELLLFVPYNYHIECDELLELNLQTPESEKRISSVVVKLIERSSHKKVWSLVNSIPKWNVHNTDVNDICEFLKNTSIIEKIQYADRLKEYIDTAIKKRKLHIWLGILGLKIPTVEEYFYKTSMFIDMTKFKYVLMVIFILMKKYEALDTYSIIN